MSDATLTATEIEALGRALDADVTVGDVSLSVWRGHDK